MQRLLREMVDAGCGACAMEVSSHALSLRRVDGMTFAAGVFTNLTRDHLDFHADMEDYFQAKRRLFEMLPRDAPSLINIDDPRGLSLAEAGGRPVTYAINRPADITPGPLSFSLDGLAFDVRTPRGTIRVSSSLVGRPNVYNILAAVSTATALGLSFDAIERGIAALDGVPGRFQVVSGARDEVTVVVDYAHTDDALRNLLETARPLARGRLITVFGCGGDRDRTKRPLMGAVAGRLSDVIVITSDNPRSEDPGRIIEEIQRGITADTRRDRDQRLLTIVDRREAIATAIELARPGRSGAHRRQGTREVSGHRQRGAAVRRCRGRAGSARPQAQQLRCRLAPMLYHLLSYSRFADHTAARRAAERDAVHHVPHGGGEPVGAGASVCALGPWMIRKLREFQIGQVIRQEGPTSHRPKAGTPTMGGLLILTAALGADAALGGPDERLHLDRRADDGGVRRRRLSRRLPEDRAPRSSRPAAALQDGRAGWHRARRRHRAARPGAAGASTTRG